MSDMDLQAFYSSFANHWPVLSMSPLRTKASVFRQPSPRRKQGFGINTKTVNLFQAIRKLQRANKLENNVSQQQFHRLRQVYCRRRWQHRRKREETEEIINSRKFSISKTSFRKNEVSKQTFEALEIDDDSEDDTWKDGEHERQSFESRGTCRR